MLKLKNFEKTLIDNKEEIVDIFCDIYGEEYKKVFNKKLDNTYFELSSVPTEDHKYLIKHIDEFDYKETLKIQQNYIDYNKNKDEAFEGIVRLKLCHEIKRCFGIDVPSQDSPNYDKFISLFVNENFDGGIIDVYSSYQKELLTKGNVPKVFFESYFKDKMECQSIMSELKIPLTVFLSKGENIVDEFIMAREELKRNLYRGFIAKSSKYGEKIHKEIKKKFKINVPENILGEFIFNKQPEFLNITSNNGRCAYIIKVPIISLINIGVECCDLSIIHELVHRMETSEEVGLGYCGKNKIVNEIRTQKQAVKIVQKMREKGIFLIDDCSNGEVIDRSFYVKLFPLVLDFFEKYEDVLNKHAINNKGENLENIFGQSWNDFSSLIDSIYYNYDKILEVDEQRVVSKFEKTCKMLVKEMEDYYEKRGIDVRRVIKN